MRALAGLMLVALLALTGTPAKAQDGDEKADVVEKAMVQAFVGLTFIPLPLDLASLESLVGKDPPAPEMTGGCDPVINRNGHEIRCGPTVDPGPAEAPVPAPGGGNGGGVSSS